MAVSSFRSFTNRIKSLITKSLPIVSAPETVSLVDLSNPTRVWAEASSIPNARGPAFDNGTPDAAEAVAAGKVTKCSPFTDSDGFNHLTQQEAK